MAFNLFNPLQGAMKNKLNAGAPLPPPKTAPGGPGNPGFVSSPSIPTGKTTTAQQDINQTNKLGINNVQYGTNTKGMQTMSPAKPGTAGTYGKFGGSGGVDYAFARPTSPQGNQNATNGIKTAQSGSGTNGLASGTVPTPSTAPAGAQPNTPGYFLNQLNTLQNQYAPVIGSSAAMPGTSTGYGQDLANFNSAALTAKEAAPLAGLQATMPQAFGYTSNVINPVTGQSFGAGAAGQGGAFQGGQQSGEFAAGANSAQMVHTLGSAQAVGNNLNQLITSANINPADPQFLNSINQFLQTGVMSNHQYQQFYGAINDYVASLAPILGVGGAPTDQKTSMAGQMVNQLASGKSIQQTIQYFDNLAQQKIQGYNQGGSFSGSTGGGGGGFYDF